MNETPTRGPIRTSITHHAREVSSSRHSFSRCQTKGVFRKGKEDLFQVVLIQRAAEIRHGALAAHASAAQQDEAIAHARGIADLVNREKERPPGGRVRAERGADISRLSQVQPVERLIRQEQWMRREHADREESPLPLSLRQRADRRAEQRPQIEPGDHIGAPGPAVRRGPRAAEKSHGEVERPADCLRRPRRNAVRKIEDPGRPLAGREYGSTTTYRPRVVREQPCDALEQRGLPGPVRSDQSQHFPRTNRQRHVGHGGEPPVRFREAGHGHQGRRHRDRESLSTGGYYYQRS
jgi:hypothetical protein